jgi:hypothetical protein
MSAKRLLKRIVSVLLMTVVTFVLLTVIRAEATPIRPDVRKVLAEPQPSADNFSPARAGWNGPETASSAQPINTTYEQLSPATSARNVRQSLIAAALPDYRVLAAILLVVLLLRRIRKAYQKAHLATAAPVAAPVNTLPVPLAETDASVESEEIGEGKRAA